MDGPVFSDNWDIGSESEFELEIEHELSAEAPLAKEEIMSLDNTSNESLCSSFDDIYEVNKQACGLLPDDVEDSDNEFLDFASSISSDERCSNNDLEAEQSRTQVPIDIAESPKFTLNVHEIKPPVTVSQRPLSDTLDPIQKNELNNTKCVKTKIVSKSVSIEARQDKCVLVAKSTSQNVHKDTNNEVKLSDSETSMKLLNPNENSSSSQTNETAQINNVVPEIKACENEAELMRIKSSERFAADLHKARLLKQRLLAAQAQSSVALTEKLKQILAKNMPIRSSQTNDVDVINVDVSNLCFEEPVITKSLVEVCTEEICAPDSPRSESVATDDMIDSCNSCDDDDWDEILRNN